MTAVPDFITHYHLPDRRPFLNLSDLDDTSMGTVLSELRTTARTGFSQRQFGPRYMELRRSTETLLRSRFVGRGGRPSRTSPHYFVLGESPWFRGLYRDASEVRVPLAALRTEHVSVTYPDSVTSMGLLSGFGIDVSPRDHHENVYRIDELPGLIERCGLPSGVKPGSYEGHQRDDFEHYIEVQVWSDDAPGSFKRRE